MRLLHRSTRKLTLTDAGEAFYARCVDQVEELSEAATEPALCLQILERVVDAAHRLHRRRHAVHRNQERNTSYDELRRLARAFQRQQESPAMRPVSAIPQNALAIGAKEDPVRGGQSLGDGIPERD